MRSALPIRDRARGLRRSSPSPERRLWRELQELNRLGCHFRRQVPIGPWFADFAWLSLKLVVEIDGEGHVTAEGRKRDATRDRAMRSAGYIVLRFWNAEVLSSAETVGSRVLQEANRLRAARCLSSIGRD
jgi:very-short-patch-repair endonuclease